MFCKVCFDSNVIGFNNHNVKDYAGNVICPTLLNTKCLKCGYFGHTTKYCKNDNYCTQIKKSNAEIKKVVKFSKGTKLGVITNNNIFNSLCIEIDDDAENYSSLEIPTLNDIIWGVGFRSMIGVSWADDY